MTVATTRLVEVRRNVMKKNDQLRARAARADAGGRRVRGQPRVESGRGEDGSAGEAAAELGRAHRVAALVGDLATENDRGAAGAERRAGAADRDRDGVPSGRDDGGARARRLGPGRSSIFCSSRTWGIWCVRRATTSARTCAGAALGDGGGGQAAEFPTIFNTADVAVITKIDLAEAWSLTARRRCETSISRVRRCRSSKSRQRPAAA